MAEKSLRATVNKMHPCSRAATDYKDLLEMLNRCEMWLSTHPEGNAMMMAVRETITKATAE